MALEFLASLTNLGFPQILLWLLTFAVVYGVLSTVEGGLPKSQGARAIIAIVAAFFVLLGTPTSLISVLTKMSSSLILIVVGILVLIVFLEVAQVRVHGKIRGYDKEGKPMEGVGEMGLHQKYILEFGIILMLIVVYIFFASGGAQLLGMPNVYFNQQTIATIAFFVIIVGAIAWMIKGK